MTDYGKPQRETVVANTSRRPGQMLETTANKQVIVPQPVIKRTPNQGGESYPDADPYARPASRVTVVHAGGRTTLVQTRPVGKHPALAAGYKPNDPEEGIGTGAPRPGGVKVR